MTTGTSALNQAHFQDAEQARVYLERLRWPDGPICPHCGVIANHYALKGKTHRAGLWKCRACREQFSITVGTVFERSKIPLNVWLQAVHLLCSSKKGMSSHQLHRTLGVTYKTAWFMTHRIREAMTERKFFGSLGSGGGTVEADETFWGNGPQSKIGREDTGKRRGIDRKMKIFSIVERGGKARSFVVQSVTGATLKPILALHAAADAKLMTDEGTAYRGIRKAGLFKSHDTVNHSLGEYARGHVTTNTVESFFAILKRGLVGTFHHVGEQHLQRYVSEFDFRYNNRMALGVSDSERTTIALKGIAGKRLTYRRTDEQDDAKYFVL